MKNCKQSVIYYLKSRESNSRETTSTYEDESLNENEKEKEVKGNYAWSFCENLNICHCAFICM